MFTKRVLVIDDEQDNRDAVQRSLNVLTSWDVLTAASAAEGMTIAQTEQPDAILLDILMPEIDGFTAFCQMQANPSLQHIPIIFFTDTADLIEQQAAKFLDEQQAAKLQTSGIITQPFQPINLVEQMRSILDWND